MPVMFIKKFLHQWVESIFWIYDISPQSPPNKILYFYFNYKEEGLFLMQRKKNIFKQNWKDC